MAAKSQCCRLLPEKKKNSRNNKGNYIQVIRYAINKKHRDTCTFYFYVYYIFLVCYRCFKD